MFNFSNLNLQSFGSNVSNLINGYFGNNSSSSGFSNLVSVANNALLHYPNISSSVNSYLNGFENHASATSLFHSVSSQNFGSVANSFFNGNLYHVNLASSVMLDHPTVSTYVDSIFHHTGNSFLGF